MADPHRVVKDLLARANQRTVTLNLSPGSKIHFRADFANIDRTTAQVCDDLKKARERIAHLESKLSQQETSARSSQRHIMDTKVNGHDHGFHMATVADVIENAQDILLADKAELRLQVEALRREFDKKCHDLYQQFMGLRNKADDCLHVGTELSSDANSASDDGTPSDDDEIPSDDDSYDMDSSHSEYMEDNDEDSDDELPSDSPEDFKDIEEIIGGGSLDKNLQYSKRTHVRSNLSKLDGARTAKVPKNAQASLNKATKTAPLNNKRPSAHIVSDTDEEDGLPISRGVRAKVHAAKAGRKPTKKQKVSAGYEREAYQPEPDTESSSDEEDGLPIRRGVSLRALRGVKPRPTGQKSNHIRVSGKKERKVAFANDPKLSQPQPANVGHVNVLESTNAHYGYGEASKEKTYHLADANEAAGSVAETSPAKYNEPGNHNISTMSELTPGANSGIVAMRDAVNNANIPADVRDSCIHKLDTLDTLMANGNDQLISGLMEVTAMIEAYSGSNESLTTTMQEDPDDAHYHPDVEAEHERSQSDLHPGDLGAVEGHFTVAIKSNINPVSDTNEGGLYPFAAFRENHVIEKQPKDNGTDNLSSGLTYQPSEMEMELKAEFLKRNICELFAQGKCCPLEHTSKAQVARLLESDGIPEVWSQEDDAFLRSKGICGGNAQDRCCMKAHRPREQIFNLLSKVDERLADYYTIWPVDDVITHLDIDEPPPPSVLRPSGLQVPARYNSKLANSQGSASSDSPDDKLDNHVDDNVPESVKESEASQTAEALNSLGICDGYYHGKCCGQVHLSIDEAQSLVPQRGPNVMGLKKSLIKDHNVCWQHISHQIPNSKSPMCCQLHHPGINTMSEEIHDFLAKEAQKREAQQVKARREAAQELRIANTPVLPGLTPFTPTFR